MTREEIIAHVRESTAGLGHAPTAAEFLAMGKVTRYHVRKHFGTHRRMLSASGLEHEGAGYPISLRSLFLDWARIVRSLGKVPGTIDYGREGKYSLRPLSDRFGNWRDVPAGMLQVARQEGLEGEWQDVLDIIALHQQTVAKWPRTARITSATARSSAFRPRSLDSQPAYGRPLSHAQAPLSYAPTNEAGVVLFFGGMARALGFIVMRVQAEFPDCEALREVAPNRWQRVRIEFEYESYSFLVHMHPATDCDLIVCWSHNWPDCPVEVLELQSLAGNIEDSTITKAPLAFRS
jgi:Homing endonuclease associated repeat